MHNILLNIVESWISWSADECNHNETPLKLKIIRQPQLWDKLSILNVNSRYNYEVNLRKKLAQPVVIVPLLNGTVMQGSKGAVGNVTLPAGKLDELLL